MHIGRTIYQQTTVQTELLEVVKQSSKIGKNSQHFTGASESGRKARHDPFFVKF